MPHGSPCPAGTAGGQLGQTSRAACKRCAEGRFCPAGKFDLSSVARHLLLFVMNRVCLTAPVPNYMNQWSRGTKKCQIFKNDDVQMFAVIQKQAKRFLHESGMRTECY